jgi:hypothetical protein
MSALSAIETPVATAPEPRTAAGREVALHQRARRAVGDRARRVAAQARHDAIGDGQPRSSSIFVTGSQPPTAQALAAQVPAVGALAAQPAGPRLASASAVELASAMVSRSGLPPAPAADPRTARAALVLPGPGPAPLRARPQTAPVVTACVSPARLRLTRRGRIVVAALVLAAVIAAALLITLLASGGAQATSHGQARGGYQGMHQVVVQPGQTLWSIAAAAEPTADPRTVIQEIMAANALGNSAISAGQLLWVP